MTPEAELERFVNQWADRHKQELAQYSIDDITEAFRLVLMDIKHGTDHTQVLSMPLQSPLSEDNPKG